MSVYHNYTLNEVCPPPPRFTCHEYTTQVVAQSVVSVLGYGPRNIL